MRKIVLFFLVLFLFLLTVVFDYTPPCQICEFTGYPQGQILSHLQNCGIVGPL